MSWPGEKQRHAMSSRGVSTHSFTDQDYKKMIERGVIPSQEFREMDWGSKPGNNLLVPYVKEMIPYLHQGARVKLLGNTGIYNYGDEAIITGIIYPPHKYSGGYPVVKVVIVKTTGDPKKSFRRLGENTVALQMLALIESDDYDEYIKNSPTRKIRQRVRDF